MRYKQRNKSQQSDHLSGCCSFFSAVNLSLIHIYTEDCTSVLAGASSDGRIFIWDGYLYFLDRSPDTSGSTIINILGDSGSANVEADQAELYLSLIHI